MAKPNTLRHELRAKMICSLANELRSADDKQILPANTTVEVIIDPSAACIVRAYGTQIMCSFCELAGARVGGHTEVEL